MIIVCEPHWTGTVHAPVNAAMLRIIARAFPEEPIRMLADATHLAELRRDPLWGETPNVTFQAITISPLHRGSPQIVSFSRLRAEWRLFRHALAAIPRDTPCQLVLLSTTATALFIAAWFTRLRGKRTSAIIVLHGNLNEAIGWRPRNPLARMLDMRSGLCARHPNRLRFLVLEPGIQDELVRLLPLAAHRTAVLPHPVNGAEIAAYPALHPRAPIRIGLVGQATKSKGIDHFLAIAERLRARHGDRIEFHLVGPVPAREDLARFSALAHPVSSAPLSRADFTARLARLHYVMFTLDPDYYSLAASGAVVDAITALKPLLATPIPTVNALFAEFGDIGHLAADIAGLEAEIDQIMVRMDTDRYAAQVASLRRVRNSRGIDALVPRWRALAENTAASPAAWAP